DETATLRRFGLYRGRTCYGTLTQVAASAWGEIMYRSAVLALRASATVVFFAFTVGAGSKAWAIETCPEYAARGISQVQMAQGCFQGPIWSPNIADHLNWCRGKTPQQMTSEDAGRRSELARGCRNNPVQVSIRSCEEYAWRALSQVELAHQMANSI